MTDVGDAPDRLPRVTTAVRTLLAAGFTVVRAERSPGYAIIVTTRMDEFGAIQSHTFQIAEDSLGSAQLQAAQIVATHHRSELVVVGNAPDAPNPLPWDRFLNMFGGLVSVASVFEPTFATNLVTLSRNHLPPDLAGRPDDLFETHVHSAFEFIFGGRVVRYGQSRRFESRADGIIVPQWRFAALYDAKAYADGYEVTADSIRQFLSYVQDFHSRYEAFVPRLTSFIVVSSDFPQGSAALEAKSRDLQGECGVPISFMTAQNLADVLLTLTKNPRARLSIDWPRVLVDTIFDPSRVHAELGTLRRDSLLP